MDEVHKPKRRLKKSVKITGFALAAALTGITLTTTVKHFNPSEIEITNKDEDKKEENSVSITAETIQKAVHNYCANNGIDYSYIWKNTDEPAYIIHSTFISNDKWQLIDNDIFFQELVDLNYDQFNSYWVKKQQLTIKTNDSDPNSWQDTHKTRIVPDTVPNLVFEGEDKLWSLTNRELVVNDEYNVFEFLQVYKNIDNTLFIGFEPILGNSSDWEYIASLSRFIDINYYSYQEPKK